MTGCSVPEEFGRAVSWRAFDDQALDEARAKNVPLFVLVHDETSPWSWAEADVLAGSEVAGMLAKDFIPVFADANAYPALALAGQALCRLFDAPGWPLILILTPELRPIFATSWLPPRKGAKLADYLPRIKWLWLMKRAEVESAGLANWANWKRALAPLPASSEPADWNELVSRAVSEDADEEFGGWGTEHKFPWPWRLRLALRDPAFRKLADRTLLALLTGGLNDRFWGGFHAYSLDRQFLTPRLGAPLDLQASLTLAVEQESSLGASVAKNAVLGGQNLIRGSLPRAGRVLFDSRGGWSKYLLERAQVCSLLADRGEAVCDGLSVSAEGWYSDPVTGRRTGGSVPTLTDPGEVAERHGLTAEELARAIADGLNRLKPAEEPPVSRWTLTSPSALFAAALCRSGAESVVSARELMSALKSAVWDGELSHGLCDGLPVGSGTAADYCSCALAAFDLASPGLAEWGDWAAELMVQAKELFFDETGMVAAALDDRLPGIWQVGDSSSPSPQGLFVRGCFKMADGGRGDEWGDVGDAVLRRYSGEASAAPGNWAFLIGEGLSRAEGRKGE